MADAILSFDEWFAGIFSIATTTDASGEYWKVPSDLALAHVTRLFQNAGSLLAAISDANANAGLCKVIDEGDALQSIFNGGAAEDERIRCIEAIEHVYRDVFASRCAEILGHLDESGAKPLNEVCYMWWDVFPTWGKPERHGTNAIDRAILQLLETLLSVANDACLESALHGLGHWQLHYPADVERIIDEFLAGGRRMRPELEEYATRAREGMIL